MEKLSKAQRKGYERSTDRCEKKYERQDGSMYRSFAATCRVEVARKHARRYTKAKAK